MPHLLGIEELSKGEILALLDDAETWHSFSKEPVKKSDRLRGRTVVNLFFEASTRTRTSFELAGKRLGADVVNVSSSASSVTKGETLLDTVRNIEAMNADVIVLRHSASGAAHFVARRARAAIINAGDGAHEHPTQALLDAFTIRRRFGGFDGLPVAICGDIAHSRVARSNALCLTKLGAEVRLVGPRTVMPSHAESLAPGVRVFNRLEDALPGAKVVMVLRIQTERLAGSMLSTLREYSRTFGLNRARLALASREAIVMHPGPVNRGVELHHELADGSVSVILDQVEAGVAVRMAVLARATA